MTADIFFYNTLGRHKERFETLEPHAVKMYSCGPTVYDRQHIGNLAAVVFADTLRRALLWNGYTVKQVINITDFGHLVSDSDEGDDKMAKGLRREGKAFTLENMLALAKKYADIYFDDARALGVDTGAITFPFASQYVKDQIELIKVLEKKGFVYVIEHDGVYFDTEKFPQYGVLGGVNRDDQEHGARVDSHGKKNAADFAVWKFNPEIGWDSAWGQGFPGWHIECSAMIRAVLGEQIDIHTGGPEHIAIHHNNEIAQSEAASGKAPFSRFWLHRAWVKIDNEKISKSLGNTFYVSDVEARGFHPLSYRYWLLTAHYRTPVNFTWEALAASQSALLQLVHRAIQLNDVEASDVPEKWLNDFRAHINDDLDTPRAIATLWDGLKNKHFSPGEHKAILTEAEKVFGLQLFSPDEKMLALVKKEFGEEVPIEKLPEDIAALVREREAARSAKDWKRSDEIRAQLFEHGYKVEDVAGAVKILKM